MVSTMSVCLSVCLFISHSSFTVFYLVLADSLYNSYIMTSFSNNTFSALSSIMLEDIPLIVIMYICYLVRTTKLQIKVTFCFKCRSGFCHRLQHAYTHQMLSIIIIYSKLKLLPMSLKKNRSK